MGKSTCGVKEAYGRGLGRKNGSKKGRMEGEDRKGKDPKKKVEFSPDFDSRFGVGDRSH